MQQLRSRQRWVIRVLLLETVKSGNVVCSRKHDPACRANPRQPRGRHSLPSSMLEWLHGMQRKWRGHAWQGAWLQMSFAPVDRASDYSAIILSALLPPHYMHVSTQELCPAGRRQHARDWQCCAAMTEPHTCSWSRSTSAAAWPTCWHRPTIACDTCHSVSAS